MQTINGVTRYEPGESADEFEEFAKIDFSKLHFPYGYKVVEEDGTKKLAAATEAEAKDTLARFLNVSTDDPKVVVNVCRPTSRPGVCQGNCAVNPGFRCIGLRFANRWHCFCLPPVTR